MKIIGTYNLWLIFLFHLNFENINYVTVRHHIQVFNLHWSIICIKYVYTSRFEIHHLHNTTSKCKIIPKWSVPIRLYKTTTSVVSAWRRDVKSVITCPMPNFRRPQNYELISPWTSRKICLNGYVKLVT